jgi:hypothetical protein
MNNHRGDIQFRFGYCDATGTLIERPLYLDESQLADLRRATSTEPEIRRMLKIFPQFGLLKYHTRLKFIFVSFLQ